MIEYGNIWRFLGSSELIAEIQKDNEILNYYPEKTDVGETEVGSNQDIQEDKLENNEPVYPEIFALEPEIQLNADEDIDQDQQETWDSELENWNYEPEETQVGKAEALLNQGNEKYYSHQYEEALTYYEKALEIDSDFSQAWKSKGDVLKELNRYEEALQCYERAKDWTSIGFTLLSLGHYEEALANFEQGLQIDSSSVSDWFGKGIILKILGRYEEALICFDQALSCTYGPNLAYLHKGDTLRELGRYEEALACYDELLEFGTFDISPIWVGKGKVFNILGRYQEAIDCFDRALNLSKNECFNDSYWSIWTNRGIAVFNLNGYRAAIRNWDEGLKALQPENLNPNDSFYQLKLKAFQPSSPEYQEGCGILHQLKGDTYYREGQRQENPFPYWRDAKRSYKQALDFLTSPNLREVHLEVLQDLIKVCLALGETDTAQALRDQGTDLLGRLVQEISSDPGKIRLKQKFASFEQFRVDELAQSSDPAKQIEALELAEKRKNECLFWLHSGWSDSVASPNYPQMQELLTSDNAILNWHISPAAITTFILRQNQPLVVISQLNKIASKPRISLTLPDGRHLDVLLNEGASTQGSYPPSIGQCRDFEEWIKGWKQDYQKYCQYKQGRLKKIEGTETNISIQEKGQWKLQMEEKLAELGSILNIEAILPYLEGVSQLIMIPHRDLHLLPLKALCPEKLIIAYLPSIKVGLDLKKTREDAFARKPEKSLLVVGDPTNNLPYASLESELISQLYGGKLICGNEATKEAITQLLSQGSKIFHFAGHGKHNLAQPVQSELQLANQEKLTIKEIFELDLRPCNFVCLSACETGITGKVGLIDEFVGLASVFVAAGVSHVVGSYWIVDDQSTAFLMLKFYENLTNFQNFPDFKAGTVANAFNEAQLWLRDATRATLEEKLNQWKQQLSLSPGQEKNLAISPNQGMEQDRPFASPFNWAAFYMIGE